MTQTDMFKSGPKDDPPIGGMDGPAMVQGRWME
jgi:hypothetical protein